MNSLLILFAAAAFAFKGIFAKLAYLEGLDVETLLFVRFLSALPIYWLVAFEKKALPAKHHFTPYQLAYAALLSGLFLVAAYLDFVALTLIDASIERVILFTFPAFVIIYDLVLDRKFPSVATMIGFFITELGLCLVLGIFNNNLPNLEGCLWAVGCAVVYALYLRLAQPATKIFGSIQLNVISNTITTLIMSFLFLFFLMPEESSATTEGILYCVLIGIFCTALPFLLLFEGVKRVGAQQASLLSMPGPVFTILAAYVLLDETLSITQIIGIAVVMLGVALIQNQPRGFGVGIPKIFLRQSK